MKEYIALVRLLAQYSRYQDNPQDSARSEVAQWRIESPVYPDQVDVEKYKAELKELEVIVNGVLAVISVCLQSLHVNQAARDRRTATDKS